MPHIYGINSSTLRRVEFECLTQLQTSKVINMYILCREVAINIAPNPYVVATPAKMQNLLYVLNSNIQYTQTNAA